MNQKLYLLSLATVLSFTTTVAHAGPVYVRRAANLFPAGQVVLSGVVDGSRSITTRSGIFQFESRATGSQPWSPFYGICSDATEYLFTAPGTPHIVESITNYTSIPNAPNAYAPPLSDLNVQTRLRKLYTVAFADALTSASAVKSAAFQWAVWNIVRDPDSSLSQNQGSVYVTNGGSGTPQQVVNQANTYLSQITANTAMANLNVWTPVVWSAQNQRWERTSGQELLVLTHSPEPGFYAVLGIALAGLFAFRRRQTA